MENEAQITEEKDEQQPEQWQRGMPAPGGVPDRELTPDAVARFLEIRLGRVYAAMERGDLAKVPGRRPIRIMLSEVERFRANPPRRRPRTKPEPEPELQADGHP